MTMEQAEQVGVEATPVADTTAPEPQAQVPAGDDVPTGGQPDTTASTEQQSPPQEPTAEAQSPPQGPATEPQSPAGNAQYSPQQIEEMRRSASQYQEVQQRAALQNQAQAYQKQLEQQGYLPEHAQQAATHYMQSQEQQQRLIQQADAYGQHLQGKQMAAEHFVKKYNLGVEDFTSLRQYEDPQSMEQGAKKLAADRERDNELAKFKQAQVPAQSFDNSQGNPQVAANEGSWLDRYNSGDRSPQAEAAAKRAAGLG